MSVAQENCPVELVPKIGVGIMCVSGFLYHMDKNGVKAGKTLRKEWKYG